MPDAPPLRIGPTLCASSNAHFIYDAIPVMLVREILANASVGKSVGFLQYGISKSEPAQVMNYLHLLAREIIVVTFACGVYTVRYSSVSTIVFYIIKFSV
jgi:hypothetical protein